MSGSTRFIELSLLWILDYILCHGLANAVNVEFSRSLFAVGKPRLLPIIRFRAFGIKKAKVCIGAGYARLPIALGVCVAARRKTELFIGFAVIEMAS
jgi:hypothetical protein